MTTTYLLANARKQQFLNLDGLKLKWRVPSLEGTALCHLLNCDSGVNAECRVASWAGDPLYLIGEEFYVAEYPEVFGEIEDGRTECGVALAERFADITLNAIALCCTNPTLAANLFDDAQNNDRLFCKFAHIEIYLKSPTFHGSFVHRFGGHWRTRYGQIERKNPGVIASTGIPYLGPIE